MKRTINAPTGKTSICKNWLIKSLNRLIGVTYGILLLIFFLFISFQMVKSQDKNDESPIKINTVLVNIPVIASDKDGRNISGLVKENFEIFQDGVKQNIEFFADEDAPMNIVILIDKSVSTKNSFEEIQKSATEFIEILRPEDKCLLATFDYSLNILSEFTSDKTKLVEAIKDLNNARKAGSNMQDAIFGFINDEFKHINGRKAIIVLTDGLVEGRIISNENLIESLISSDVIVYPIIFDYVYSFRQTVDEVGARKAKLYTKSLANITGGKFYEKDSSNLGQAFGSIANELKKQYLIGYYPKNAVEEKTYQIRVEIDQKDILIRTKTTLRIKNLN